MSRTYSIHSVQHLPIPVAQAWDFFSRPENLAEITPKNMGFVVKSKQAPHIYAGQVIEYTVKPVLGIPLYWMTEITHVKDHVYFVDEQRFGPYSLWHHQHHFTPVDGGVEMADIVHYRIPFGWLGNLAHVLFVKKKLGKIFDYRREIVAKRFGGSL